MPIRCRLGAVTVRTDMVEELSDIGATGPRMLVSFGISKEGLLAAINNTLMHPFSWEMFAAICIRTFRQPLDGMFPFVDIDSGRPSSKGLWFSIDDSVVDVVSLSILG